MRIRLFAFCLLLGGCQSQLPPLPDWQSPEGRDDPQTGRIVELRSGVTLSPQQLVARLAAAPRVIVGEKHDNPDHHAVELWLAQALGEYRAQGSLLLEMLDPGATTGGCGPRTTRDRQAGGEPGAGPGLAERLGLDAVRTPGVLGGCATRAVAGGEPPAERDHAHLQGASAASRNGLQA